MRNKTTKLIWAFGISKLILHFLTNTNYGLHRDEYLYFDQGNHLAWGYFEVPPFTPFIGSLSGLLGGGTFAIRLFPAIAGLIIIVLACKLAKDLGGGTWAVFVTGLALTLNTSLLGSNTLFQPVSFNQLFWFLIAYSIVQLIRTSNKKQYYTIGFFIGLGILTKYSVIFYLLSLLMGIGLTKQRQLLLSKHFLATLVIALLIALPNILWQINKNFPVLAHMQDLSETQLVHIDWPHYITAQFIAHKGFTIVWLLGLVGLLGFPKYKNYQSLGFAFILVLLLIGFLQGKPYYALGAFLILVPFGGLFIERYLRSNLYKGLLCIFMFILSLPFYPFSLPVLKVDTLKEYTQYLSEHYGINYMLRWEDDNYYQLPQDIADMHGWEELAKRVSTTFHTLSEEKKATCMILAGSYGHAGSLSYYREKYSLPEAYSLNGSYAYWARENINFDNQILIDDRKHDGSDWFAEMTLVDSVRNPNAREKGYIYYRTKPKINLTAAWTNVLQEAREH